MADEVNAPPVKREGEIVDEAEVKMSGRNKQIKGGGGGGGRAGGEALKGTDT